MLVWLRTGIAWFVVVVFLAGNSRTMLLDICIRLLESARTGALGHPGNWDMKTQFALHASCMLSLTARIGAEGILDK